MISAKLAEGRPSYSRKLPDLLFSAYSSAVSQLILLKLAPHIATISPNNPFQNPKFQPDQPRGPSSVPGCRIKESNKIKIFSDLRQFLARNSPISQPIRPIREICPPDGATKISAWLVHGAQTSLISNRQTDRRTDRCERCTHHSMMMWWSCFFLHWFLEHEEHGQDEFAPILATFFIFHPLHIFMIHSSCFNSKFSFAYFSSSVQ